MSVDERTVDRSTAVQLLATDDGAALLRHLRRVYRSGAPSETEHQMLNRLGRLDALADLERLREEAKGS
jgi:hypothetical protein